MNTCDRRSFLTAVTAVWGGLFAPAELQSARIFGKKGKPSVPRVDGGPIVPITTGLGSTGDIYAELGITPLVNINGTLTVIGGSVMKPEVMELIRRGNEHCISIDELEVAAGKFIAKLCKSPAGYTGLVTGGAAAAMVAPKPVVVNVCPLKLTYSATMLAFQAPPEAVIMPVIR